MSNAQPEFESPLYSFDGSAAPQSGPQKVPAAPYLVSPSQTSAAVELAIAVIGPNPDRRAEAVRAFSEQQGCMVRQFSTFSSAGETDLARLVNEQYNIALIDLEGDSDYALDLIRRIGALGQATVMAYSATANHDLLVRCMRAGAREFFETPFSQSEVGDALARVARLQPAPLARKKGKLLVFVGAKGGVGVTSLACNFAVALAQQPEQKTLLIDLNLPLGDAALNLGIVSQFSTVDALQAVERLDGEFLQKLVVEHSSGVSVLAAPGKYPYTEPDCEALERLLMVARRQFDNVVVDMGSRINPEHKALYDEATAVYLVTQAGIPELRNANRLISQVFAHMASEGTGEDSLRPASPFVPKLEIVLNCFEKSLGIGEEHIRRALTRPAQWKVPNDQALLRKMQINATPLALGDSQVARTIRQMACAVNPPQEDEGRSKGKKKGLGLFG
jgi:pilus assembly protein CpaE